MKSLRFLVSTSPQARVSPKLLLYALLCTLWGTACFYCGATLMLMSGFGIDGGVGGQHPYDRIALTVGLLIALLLFSLTALLWFLTLLGLSRPKRHLILTAVVALAGFCPAFLLMNAICDLGEGLGQWFLYGGGL